MLFIPLIWLLIGISTSAIGWLWWRMWASLGLPGRVPPLELLSLSGIAVLILVLQPVSLLAPINNWARCWVGGLTIATLLWQRRALGVALRQITLWPQSNKLAFGLFLLLGVELLIRCSTYTHNHDAQLYYIQSLQWIEQFPVVPGLGNLHGRLAFNISLFLPTALYKIPTPNGAYYGLPTYFYLLLLVAAIRGATSALQRKTTTWWSWAYLLVYVCLTQFFRVWISSPAPDCTLAVLLSFIFLRYAKKWQTEANRLFDQDTVLLILLVCVAVTIKLSAFPILLLLLPIVWTHYKQLNAQKLLAIVALSIGVWTPWFLRSVFLSGYLVYPLPVFNWLQVDWKVSMDQVQLERSLIINMARHTAATIRQQAPQSALTMWLPKWWDHNRTNPDVLILLQLVVLSPLLMSWYWYKVKRILPEQGVWAGWLTAITGSIFWFVAAPDYRFGIGFLLIAGLWPWLSLLSLRALSRKASMGVALLIICWTLQNLRDPFYQVRDWSPMLYTHLVWPAVEPHPATSIEVVENHAIYIAQIKGACGDTPLPCTYRIAPGLEFRGTTLADGFRITNATINTISANNPRRNK